ncbi:hypothetical protein BH20ACI3_BH20ACI3_03770 [soil metagenome]
MRFISTCSFTEIKPSTSLDADRPDSFHDSGGQFIFLNHLVHGVNESTQAAGPDDLKSPIHSFKSAFHRQGQSVTDGEHTQAYPLVVMQFLIQPPDRDRVRIVHT